MFATTKRPERLNNDYRGLRVRLGAALGAAAVLGAIVVAPSAAHAVAPTAVNDDYIVGAQATFASPFNKGVLANDIAADQLHSLTILSAPAHGNAVAVGAGGSFTYRPNDGFVGVDSFQYCVSASPGMGLCLSGPATVTIVVQSTIERIGGADRFVVSAATSAGRFGPMTGVAYIASGSVFPDALSASATAGALGGPVLLVTKDSIPQPVKDELTRLKPQKIVVVGGTNTVSTQVQEDLKAFSMNISRVDGPDRYAVSAGLATSAFTGPRPYVYIASGENFPDALSGSAAAGKRNGPVLLVPKNSLPDSIRTALTALSPAKIVVLGGQNSVSEAVVTALKTVQADTSRVAGDDRFVVSAAVSAGVFTIADTHTLYVASGTGFPDALSGSAAAISVGAPVLLVTKDAVPAAIQAELTRLDPKRIVVLGGGNTISEEVMAKLKSYLVS